MPPPTDLHGVDHIDGHFILGCIKHGIPCLIFFFMHSSQAEKDLETIVEMRVCAVVPRRWSNLARVIL